MTVTNEQIYELLMALQADVTKLQEQMRRIETWVSQMEDEDKELTKKLQCLLDN
ncbi:hypothetical protein MNJPNG_14930 [Cupriavidus oxalaticus]|uniref:hypothetical protein n=1 Tax=Cupriavidus oxalaticus TaxID=96344 RepID=UPI003F73D67D